MAGYAAELSAQPLLSGEQRTSTLYAGLLACATALSLALATSSLEPLLAFAALLALGVALLRGEYRSVFFYAFALNVVLVVAIALYLTRTYGAPFSVGEDDLLFHDVSLRIARDFGRAGEYTHYSGYGFIVISAAVHALLDGIAKPDPLTIRIVNAFVGATIPVAVLCLRGVLPELQDRTISRAAFITALFPTLTFFAGVGLRDIWICAGSVWFIVLALRPRSPSARIGALAMLLLVATVRPLSVVPLLAFWFVLILHMRNSMTGLFIKAASIAFAAWTSYKIWALATLLAGLETMKYGMFAAQRASEGSLGMRLLRLPTPISQVARFVYALFLPVPPAPDFDPYRMPVALGAMAWYYLLPFTVIGAWYLLRNSQRKDLPRATVVFLIVAIAGVAMTSLDVRHKIIVIPFGILLACHALAHMSRARATRIAGAYTLVLAALAVLYLNIKFL